MSLCRSFRPSKFLLTSEFNLKFMGLIAALSSKGLKHAFYMCITLSTLLTQ